MPDLEPEIPTRPQEVGGGGNDGGELMRLISAELKAIAAELGTEYYSLPRPYPDGDLWSRLFAAAAEGDWPQTRTLCLEISRHYNKAKEELNGPAFAAAHKTDYSLFNFANR